MTDNHWRTRTTIVQVPDNARMGKEARAARLKAGLSLREVSRRLKISAMYLSELERGMKAWNKAKLIGFYLALR